jgi:hypothetical protein
MSGMLFGYFLPELSKSTGNLAQNLFEANRSKRATITAFCRVVSFKEVSPILHSLGSPFDHLQISPIGVVGHYDVAGLGCSLAIGSWVEQNLVAGL